VERPPYTLSCSVDRYVINRARIRYGIPRRRHRHRHADILARILADTSDTRDFPWQAERHADILATILASREDVGEDVGVGVGVVECQLYESGDARHRTAK